MANDSADSKKGGEAPAGGAAAAAPASGGIKAWLPLILTVVLMPALAYAMTTFVLLPKLQKGLGQGAEESGEPASQEHGASSGEASHGEKSGGKEASAGKAKYKAPLSKIVVNVSGSLGTRLLLASLTLAGSASDFKTRIEEHNDQLRDLASSTLGSKTIADLEKPESRNQIRAELLSQFNAALGNGVVQDIYITELAIQ